MTGPGDDFTGAMVIHDPSGDVTIVGGFEQNVTIADQVLTSRGPMGRSDAYVARLDKNGRLLWAEQAGGSTDDFALLAEPDGEEALVSGWYTGMATFGRGANEVTIDAGAGATVIARFDPTGVLKRAFKLPGFVRTMVSDDAGHIYVAGDLETTLTFTTGGTDITLEPYGDHDLFLARLDSNAVATWASRISSLLPRVPFNPHLSVGGGSVVLACFVRPGAVYSIGASNVALGNPNNDGMLADIGASTGALTSFLDIGYPGFVVPGATAVVGGTIISAGLVVSTDESDFSAYIAAFRDGSRVWRSRMPGTFGPSSNSSFSVTATPGGVLVMGEFEGRISLSEKPGSLALTANDEALFVARYDLSGEVLSGRTLGMPGWLMRMDPYDLPIDDSVPVDMEILIGAWVSGADGAGCFPGARPYSEPLTMPSDLFGPPTTFPPADGHDAQPFCVRPTAILGCE